MTSDFSKHLSDFDGNVFYENPNNLFALYRRLITKVFHMETVFTSPTDTV